MASSSSSTSTAFSGYNFTPVNELPIHTEWEFTTATMNHHDTDDTKMFPFEDSDMNLLSSLSAIAPPSTSSCTDNDDVVFGPLWMDDNDDDQQQVDDDMDAPRRQPDNDDEEEKTNNDEYYDLAAARPLEDLFNNALYFDNEEDLRQYDFNHNHNQTTHTTHNQDHHNQDNQDQNNHHETAMMTIDDSQGFLAPLLNHVVDPIVDYNASLEQYDIGLPLEERYMVTLNKLEASMKRSMESRNCLTIQTSTINTDCYDRSKSIHELMSSITASSNQVQKYVTSISHKQRQAQIV